jgi:hypothetical protein
VRPARQEVQFVWVLEQVEQFGVQVRHTWLIATLPTVQEGEHRLFYSAKVLLVAQAVQLVWVTEHVLQG